MVLVTPANPGRSVAAGISGQPVKSSKESSRHKVVLETVTQEKKKLRSTISFRTQPPPGYTFIPAGNPELTQALKECARKGGYEILAVTTTPHQRVHDLSKEVHRIGFHFPSVVVAQVCAEYGIALTSAGTLVTDEAESFSRRRKGGARKNADDDLDQVSINTKARDAIKDLFPNIPDNDVYQIIKTAFQKGQKKVGTASELSLVRRAQLSVVAHIRHIYTNYDRLLRTVGYHDARGKVEGPTLKKLVEWRGDDENGKKVLEDVFREVIVLSDEEDSDDEEEIIQRLGPTDLNVEVLSSKTHGPRTEWNNAGKPQATLPHDLEHGHFSEDEAPTGYTYLSQAPRRRKVHDDRYVDENHYRHAAWDRAREEFRAEPSRLQPIIVLDSPREPLFHPLPGKTSFNGPSLESQQILSHVLHTPTQQQQYREFEMPLTQHHNEPVVFRAADGALYEKLVSSRPEVHRVSSFPSHWSSQSTLVSTDQSKFQSRQQSTRNWPPSSSPLQYEGDRVIPSIEPPSNSPPSARQQQDMVRAYSTAEPAEARKFRVAERQIIDLTEGVQESPIKKRKLEEVSADERRGGRLEDYNCRMETIRPGLTDRQPVFPHSHEPPFPSQLLQTRPTQREAPVMSNMEPVFLSRAPRPTMIHQDENFLTHASSPVSYRVSGTSTSSKTLALREPSSLRAREHTQYFRPASPSRISQVSSHETDTRPVRRVQTSYEQPVGMVFEGGSSLSRRPIYEAERPVEIIRHPQMEYRARGGDVLDRPSHDNLPHPKREVIELVPVPRTPLYDDEAVHTRREYVPVYERSAVSSRPLYDDSPSNHYVREQHELDRPRNIEPTPSLSSRRNDRTLPPTFVQN